MGDFTLRFCTNPRKLLPRKLNIDIVNFNEELGNINSDILPILERCGRNHPFNSKVQVILPFVETSTISPICEELKSTLRPSYLMICGHLSKVLSSLIESQLLDDAYISSDGFIVHKENTVGLFAERILLRILLKNFASKQSKELVISDCKKLQSGHLYLNLTKRTSEEVGIVEGKTTKAKDFQYVTVIELKTLATEKARMEKLLTKLSHPALPDNFVCSFLKKDVISEKVQRFREKIGDCSVKENICSLETKHANNLFVPNVIDYSFDRSKDSSEKLTRLYDQIGLYACGLPSDDDNVDESLLRFCHGTILEWTGFLAQHWIHNLLSRLSDLYRNKKNQNLAVVNVFGKRDSPVLSAESSMTFSDDNLYSVVFIGDKIVLFDCLR